MNDKPKPGITPQSNGPLTVKNLDKFTNSRGEPIAVKKVMALCRCGNSKNKPFCDGSHGAVNFSDAKTSPRQDRRDSYKGKRITIHDNRSICAHSGYCTGGLPAVFNHALQPWIDPDGETAERIIETIEKCPSGALSYTIEEVEYRDRDAEPEIHVTRNGHYRVRGGVELAGFDLGDDASTEHYTLCRCGHSGNKPRCDGSHSYAAFKDDEALTISAANRLREQQEAQWHRVADADELQDDQTKKLNLNNQLIVLSRVDGKYGAIEGLCPTREAH